jgi:hypothetical protein
MVLEMSCGRGGVSFYRVGRRDDAGLPEQRRVASSGGETSP